MADHYIGDGPALEVANHPHQVLAAMPALAMAAEATSTINIGSLVFCTGYRPAPILVKEAMTIDFLSGGRFELGLGAGWLQSEYEAMGLPFPSPGERIERLEETIQLAKAAMRGEMLNIDGKYVHAIGYEAIPKPPRGKVPLIVGGGSPRVLRLAGREADIVSINFDNRSGKLFGGDSLEGSMAAGTHKKIDWIKEGAGDRFDDIEIEFGLIAVALNDAERTEAEALAASFGISRERLPEWPHALIGSLDSVCDDLFRLREEYGVNYIRVQDWSAAAFAPVVARMTGR